MRDMTLCVWHDSFMCVTWLIHVCDTTHSYVWRETWRICMGDTTHCVWHDSSMCVWHDSFICVTWNMTHSYGWHDSLCVMTMCVTWLIHVYNTTHSQHTCPRQYWWYDSMCVTCLIYVCDTTHSYVWHDSSMTHLLSAILVAKTTLRVPCGAGANAASCSAGGSAA